MNIEVPVALQVFLTLWTLGYGVQVIVFQPDGVSSTETIAVYQGNLSTSTDFASITLCQRIQLYYLHGGDTLFRLENRAKGQRYNIRVEIFLDRVRPVIGDTWIFHMFPKVLETFRWYHICSTFDSEKKLHTTYLNGKKIFSIEKAIRADVYGDYAYLGQGGEKVQSFSGEVTQLNIWKKVIPEDLIYSIANCQSNEIGNYLSWNSGWSLQNVESYDINYKDLCTYKKESFTYGFSELFYIEAFYLCLSLGSRLPMPETIADIQQVLEISLNQSLCYKDWITPLNDIEEEGTWVAYYSTKPFEGQIPWYGSEPNGLKYENCGHFWKEGIYDVDCLSQIGCALCEFTEKVIFSLRGTCEKEIRNTYFLTQQNEINHLLFKSYGEYLIQKNESVWQWIQPTKNLLIAQMEVNEINYPMGRRNWTIFEEVCDQSSGTRELVLTSCKIDEFTCSNGDCISILNRCDLKYDCYDHSDEKNCDIISYPPDYKRDLPPRGNEDTNHVLLITLTVLVESVSVDTALMEIRVSFFLHISWNDNRLNFINLKNSSNLNALTQDNFEKLWLPFIGFMNTVGNAFSEADREAFMYVSKLENKSTIDDSKSEETFLFPGNQNPFVIVRRYMATFSCNFDLILYPFDAQICAMEFQILSATKNLLAFDVNKTVADNIGSVMLTEYEVGTLSVEHTEHEGYSRVKVIVPLRRRAGFAILNIYIPSLIFLTITFVTLFFRPQIFDVRVMGALTTLLVVATLFTQLSNYLPKTSYFKAVDIWLLFCTSDIFLIIIFHVLIDLLLFNTEPDKSKIAWPSTLKVKSKINATDFEGRKFGFTLTVKRLIIIARVTVFALFTVFNIIYWGFIVL